MVKQDVVNAHALGTFYSIGHALPVGINRIQIRAVQLPHAVDAALTDRTTRYKLREYHKRELGGCVVHRHVLGKEDCS